jgi:rRNA processing protein Krr1/Pno1
VALSLIKSEWVIRIARQSGTISITPAKVTYLRVPAEIKRKIKEEYGIDLDKDRKNLDVNVFWVEERNNPSSEIKLIFTLRKLPRGLGR